MIKYSINLAPNKPAEALNKVDALTRIESVGCKIDDLEDRLKAIMDSTVIICLFVCS